MTERTLQTSESNPILTKFISMMEINRKRLMEQLKDVTDEMIDYSPNMSTIETIGTLLDHIAAIDFSWIFEDIDKLEMDFETWKYAFALRSWSKIDQRVGMGKKFYIDRITKVRSDVYDRLAQFSDSDLREKFSSDDNPDQTFTLEWLLYHLINHEALHLGQISMLKRLYRSEEEREYH